MIALIGVFVFIYGLFITSFLQLVGERLPSHETLLGRSHCDQCGRTLRMVHLIPLVGYALQKGRCRGCGKPIRVRYVLFELVGALAFLGAYLRFGLGLEFAVFAIIIAVLLVEVASDFEHLVVIDRVWLIGLVPLVVYRVFEGTLTTYLLSALGLFALLFIIALLASKVYKQEALGGGDIKLFIFIGFALPFWEGVLTLFFAALFGTLYGLTQRKQQHPMAFVPWIALAVYVVYLFGPSMIAWYLSLLEG